MVDFIFELKNENYKINTLRGNHEQLFIDSDKSFTDFRKLDSEWRYSNTWKVSEYRRYTELE